MFSDKGKLSHLKMVIFQVKAINQHLVDFSFQIFDICRWTKNIIQNVIHHFQPISIHPSTWKFNKYLKYLWLLPKFLKDLPIYIFCTTWPWSLLFFSQNIFISLISSSISCETYRSKSILRSFKEKRITKSLNSEENEKWIIG